MMFHSLTTLQLLAIIMLIDLPFDLWQSSRQRKRESWWSILIIAAPTIWFALTNSHTGMALMLWCEIISFVLLFVVALIAPNTFIED